ncbi:MAG: hypothetical protein SFW36_21890 [Leptolyngbyaceae cyanobacterium bins.59]|nr:hypothetical protein [Leptolyngbyaceae cyanobacterium bins.59]
MSNSDMNAKPSPTSENSVQEFSLVEQLLIEQVLGVALFDLNGLPQEYLATAENADMGWVQTTFQALGLRLLLMASLQLEGFQYAVINGDGYNAVVVRQNTCYIALLIQLPDSEPIADSFVRWIQTLDPKTLKYHPRFRSSSS